MLLNGNRNWNIPVYECLIRLNYHSQLKENYSCLNEKEMQLCCMMIAGFKTEEIAAIWMQSIFS